MNPISNPQGTLFVVGLGPGSVDLMTPEASAAIDGADTVVGYRCYLDLIASRLAGKSVEGRELGQEIERAELALSLAEQGRTVALVSSGDAGVYGMGGVAWELAARRETTVEIVVVPGITAACSAAARLGAPLAHDWSCISLSDLLTPWEVILRRVEAAARADFVMVFYNPASRARTRQLTAVADLLLTFRDPLTPVGLVENAYREGERVEIVSLLDLALGKANANMFTTVVVGGSRTFVARDKMITPRIHAAKNLEESATPAPTATETGNRIMAESFEIIERELGPTPADPDERDLARRAIHATADFEFATSLRFSPGAIRSARQALQAGGAVVCDVEMLRSGVRRDLTAPLGVSALCFLNDLDTARAAARDGTTRSAAGLRRAADLVPGPAVIAIGNAPTALDEALRLIQYEGWKPACVIGIPVGFVGVESAKRRLVAQREVPYITSLGRKGGTAVTAAVVNALLDQAGRAGRLN